MGRFARHVTCTFLVRETVRVYAASTPAPESTPEPEPDPTPVPHPYEDVNALEELEEEIVLLAAHIHAAMHRLLMLVADFDRRRGWELGGHPSCAHWLAVRTGMDLGAAREKVRTARVLIGLPAIGASMSRGELSFSAVRALSRVATPENEEDLLDLARGCTVAQIERTVRGWKLGSRKSEEDRERARIESRTLSVFPGDDGMVVVKGRLTPEVGALLMRAIEAASDALYRKSNHTRVSAETFQRDAGRRRADALGLMAERALAAGFGAEDSNGSSARVPLSGSRAERYQVLLHVDADTLSADGGEGRSELEDGTRVSAETSRRLACDAAMVTIDHGPDGAVRGVGRKTRTISPALRRALEARDRGCRFPSCGLRFTDAHHIRHWADGGETSLPNLLLLCAHHHRLVHEADWKIEWWGRDRPAFVDPRGQIHFDGRRRAAPKLPPDPVAALIEDTRSRGADPDYFTAGARWEREAQIPKQFYFRALEALG